MKAKHQRMTLVVLALIAIVAAGLIAAWSLRSQANYFYLPEQKVYIEFWGMEADPRYRQRMQAKQAIYAEHGFKLIELTDADVQSLDDTLPRKLLTFGIDCA